MSLGSETAWLVGSEGCAWVRQGVTPDCPAGLAWLQLAPPDPAAPLSSVEAGRDAVWGVDTQHRLWRREAGEQLGGGQVMLLPWRRVSSSSRSYIISRLPMSILATERKSITLCREAELLARHGKEESGEAEPRPDWDGYKVIDFLSVAGFVENEVTFREAAAVPTLSFLRRL